MKQKTKKINVFAPIERIDDEQRVVEAYAFVNEVVEGEGGVRLLRTAMEEATPDYMKWANVRRMHQADAVGVARDVAWDEKGARVRLEIVDDDAWRKVKRGVYKGLSVGVAPLVMRGLDVIKCRWGETSLVDRPKDPDAAILCFRAEDEDGSDEAEVEILEEDKEPDGLARMEQFPRFVARLEGIADEVERVREELDRAIERIAHIEKQPVALAAPVRYAGQDGISASPRPFAANLPQGEAGGTEERKAQIDAQIRRIAEEAAGEPDQAKREAAVLAIQRLKMERDGHR